MRIVLFGDSVFAGHGLAPADTPARQLMTMLDGDEVVPAGVPDETSANGLRRAGGIKGDLVLVEFGLNDAIDGVSRGATIANLRAIGATLGSAALFVEALMPSGSRWPALTDLTGAVAMAANGDFFVPDVLAGLERASALQEDGLHPNAAGAAIVAGRLIGPILERKRS